MIAYPLAMSPTRMTPGRLLTTFEAPTFGMAVQERPGLGTDGVR